jgi:hypothetical protein
VTRCARAEDSSTARALSGIVLMANDTEIEGQASTWGEYLRTPLWNGILDGLEPMMGFIHFAKAG